eukprot:scaffold434113_cov51-Attheya_sp.AAC.3
MSSVVASKSNGSVDSSRGRHIGNTLHMINIASGIAYMSCVVLWSEPSREFFDPAWAEEGFCTPHDNIPYWTTHDMSGYLMCCISLVGLALCYTLKEEEGMKVASQLVFWATMGALGHAAGHIIISNAKRVGFFPPGHVTGWDDIQGDSLWMIVKKLGPGYLFFWIPLVKTYMMNTSQNKVALFSLGALVGSMMLPMRNGFAYTQTILFVGLSLDQVFFSKYHHQGGFEFALWPLITVLPSTALSWVESLTCTTSFLMKDHGHLVYDAYMSSSYILFYLICWGRSKHYTLKIAPKLKTV